MTSTTPKRIGSYIVEAEVGSGGMGVVLRAQQPSLERPVVLKKLRRELADRPELVERFQRESRAAAAVHHQNVVGVYDGFCWRGNHYIVQEWVDGSDLNAVLERVGPLPWRIAALIALQISRGLEEIHAAGTVHRDLKPANVLLGRRGEVKIADFGIALEARGSALTEPGAAIGSPAYMSPEHMMGERIDSRGDLFSLSVVVYEMLTGYTPHRHQANSQDAHSHDDADESGGLLARMREERFTPVRTAAPGTPRFLARWIRSGLRARPGKRAKSSSAVRRELESRLGRPSDADCRGELASWLDAAKAWGGRRDTTRVLVAVQAPPDRGPHWLLGAAACAAAFAGVLLVDVRPEPPAASEPESMLAAVPPTQAPTTPTVVEPTASAEDADSAPSTAPVHEIAGGGEADQAPSRVR